jgi:hypothetical protein
MPESAWGPLLLGPQAALRSLHAASSECTSWEVVTIPRLELKRHAALSSALALRSLSLPLLHCSQPAHSDEPRLAGGRRHSVPVALRGRGSLWLALGVRMEACWSLWGCSWSDSALGSGGKSGFGEFWLVEVVRSPPIAVERPAGRW